MQLEAAEIGSGALSEGRVRDAAASFRRDGFVVLEGLFSPASAGRALAICRRVLERRSRERTALPLEWLRRAPFVEFVSDPLLRQVMRAALAGEVATRGFRWIRRCPPGGRSIGRVHRDDGIGPRPVTISSDVMLTDFSEENGATEIWPGSQNLPIHSAADGRSLGRRAALLESSFITGRAGSVALRDHRAWHRGGLNRSDADRVMLSIDGWHRVPAVLR